MMSEENIQHVRLQLQLHEEKAVTLEYILNDQAVIGRVGDDQDHLPDIDLSAYTGYQLGLSRRHVLLRWQDGRVEAQDLDSRNGTFINGYRLTPQQWEQLNDHDEMRLGRLVLTVRIDLIN